MVIRSIVPSQNIRDRFFVTMEDGTVIKATIQEIADHGLFSGRELSAEEYESFLRDAAESNAHARALRILGSRNMSKQKLTQRLVEKGESRELAESTADWLEEIGAVDDAEYAALIVSHYSGAGYGLRKIKDELFRRGIPSELWEDALSAMPDGSDAAYEYIAKKLGGAPPEKASAKKAADAAMRRGFSWEEVRSALSRYENEVSEQ